MPGYGGLCGTGNSHSHLCRHSCAGTGHYGLSNRTHCGLEWQEKCFNKSKPRKIENLSLLTGILAVIMLAGKATLWGGGLMPSIVSSFFTSDCRSSGKLFFRNPIKQGCGLAFSSRSNLSQNSSGSTFASISSCIRIRTFFSTDFGSLLDSSSRFARNFLHFSLVFCWFACCCCGVVLWTTTVPVPPLLFTSCCCCCGTSAGTGATEATGGATVIMLFACCCEITAEEVTTIFAEDVTTPDCEKEFRAFVK